MGKFATPKAASSQANLKLNPRSKGIKKKDKSTDRENVAPKRKEIKVKHQNQAREKIVETPPPVVDVAMNFGQQELPMPVPEVAVSPK